MKWPRVPVCSFFVATVLAAAQAALGQSQNASDSTSTAKPAQSPAAVSPSPTATPAGPLHFVAGPPNAENAIATKVFQSPIFISRAGTGGTSDQNQSANPPSLKITGPLPIYDINTIAAANNLRTIANTAAWVYFVEAGGKSVCVANMVANRTHKVVAAALEFTSSEPTASTLRTLATLDPIRTGAYEVRFLRSQPDGLKAIWLKSLNGGTDYVYVAPSGLYGTPGQRNGIQADKLYTLDDFVKLFLPILQERAARPDDPNAFG